MFAQLRWFGVVMVLAGASLLGTPSLSFAQRGGHGGGGHVGGFGGGHVGGFGGGHVGGFGGGHVGGFGGGGFRGIYYGGFGGYGYGLYGGGYYPGGGYNYGGYPTYNYYPYTYSGPSYTSSYAVSPSIYYPSYAQSDSTATPAFTFASGAETAPASTKMVAQTDTPVGVTVVAPENAKLWFNDVQVNATGKTREFQTPALTPGRSYLYHVRASWMQDGHEVSQTQDVTVTPGSPVRVEFPSASAVGTQGTIPQ